MATDKGFFNYWVVASSGKGFITHTDSRKFWIGGFQETYGYVMIFLNQEIGVQEIVPQVKQNHKHKQSLLQKLQMLKMHGMLYQMKKKQHHLEDQVI